MMVNQSIKVTFLITEDFLHKAVLACPFFWHQHKLSTACCLHLFPAPQNGMCVCACVCVQGESSRPFAFLFPTENILLPFES